MKKKTQIESLRILYRTVSDMRNQIASILLDLGDLKELPEAGESWPMPPPPPENVKVKKGMGGW